MKDADRSFLFRSRTIESGAYIHFPDPAAQKIRIIELLRKDPAPVFIADKRILADRYRQLDEALSAHWSANHAIAYSFKTNYPAAQSNILKEMGAWAEVDSGREYEMARGLGYPGERIIVNGPYKTDAQLKQAATDKARLHIYDSDELERLAAVAQGFERVCEMAVRVNTTASGLGRSRLGFSIEDGSAAAAIERIRHSERLRLIGLHMHLHGDTDDPGCYGRAAEAMAAFIAGCIPEYRDSIRYLDMGGGFPGHGPKPRRRTSWNPQEIEHYVRAIATGLGELWPAQQRPTLAVEPGRYLVGDSNIFVIRVVRINESSRSSQTVMCNGAINMLPLIHYCPPVVGAFSEGFTPRDGELLATKVYGCSPREDDVLFEGPLPKIHKGDYLVFYAVGAYNSNMAPDFVYAAPKTVFL